jgi:mRNA interferase RelE/StbE
MTYELEFKETALKEWRKLDGSLREQFKKKLAERLENPRVEASKLTGMADCYKIKPKGAGYRMVYQVVDVR